MKVFFYVVDNIVKAFFALPFIFISQNIQIKFVESEVDHIFITVFLRSSFTKHVLQKLMDCIAEISSEDLGERRTSGKNKANDLGICKVVFIVTYVGGDHGKTIV